MDAVASRPRRKLSGSSGPAAMQRFCSAISPSPGSPNCSAPLRWRTARSTFWSPTPARLSSIASPRPPARTGSRRSLAMSCRRSAVGCARALIPAMRRRGWGRIITIGTRGVATPLPNMVEYSAAKAALVNATGALARELAGSGITANVVSPGVILTSGLREMFEERARSAGNDRT